MVSTTSFDASKKVYRHDLLLAYNYEVGGKARYSAFIFRLVPQFPATGDGLGPISGSPWTLESLVGESAILPTETTRVWLVSGQAAPGFEEGTAFYGVMKDLTNFSGVGVQKVNVTDPLHPEAGPIFPISDDQFPDDTETPVLLRIPPGTGTGLAAGGDTIHLENGSFIVSRIQLTLGTDTGFSMPAGLTKNVGLRSFLSRYPVWCTLLLYAFAAFIS